MRAVLICCGPRDAGGRVEGLTADDFIADSPAEVVSQNITYSTNVSDLPSHTRTKLMLDLSRIRMAGEEPDVARRRNLGSSRLTPNTIIYSPL